MNNKSTRRDILKFGLLGSGTLLCDSMCGFAQQGRGRRGQPLPISPDNPSIQHITRNCRGCGRCRDFCRTVTTVFGQPVPRNEDACINCGQCTTFCRRFAIAEKYHYPELEEAISDPQKIVVTSISPAIRVSLGEMFRLAPGTNVEGKIFAALKEVGVDHVLDTTFAADLTVMEEASELIHRLNENSAAEPLPMFTSCCPAWVRFAKLFYPELLPHISTVKSPVMMQGAMVKTYYAQKMGLDPSQIFHAALTPCTAKKAEILLPGNGRSENSRTQKAIRDVDVAL
ncbi:MAG: [Fe-Fe] hydrogenase large subunit C-terminal domain-containing protein, partial [Thermoguttaceae bacterium]